MLQGASCEMGEKPFLRKWRVKPSRPAGVARHRWQWQAL